jgi:NADPH-dependent ferric siderophore reductase
MQPKKPTMRLTHVSKIIDLSPHLRRVVFSGDSLNDFPVGLEGSYVKVVFQQKDEKQFKMRSYAIRFFNPETK